MSAMPRKGREVPEDAIEAAERDEGVPAHAHDGVSGQDGSLLEHLRRVHRVEAAGDLSPATQEGLHDRVHGSTGASDD